MEYRRNALNLLAQVALCLASSPFVDIQSTCEDSLCISPEFSDSCPEDCRDKLSNPNLIRDSHGRIFSSDVRPQHLAREFHVVDGRAASEGIPSVWLVWRSGTLFFISMLLNESVFQLLVLMEFDFIVNHFN
jgi:hypothetical protein